MTEIIEIKIYIMSFVHKYRCRNRSSSTLKRIAKITQVIDSRLWHENIEELTISKRLKRKKPHYPPPPKDQAKWITLSLSFQPSGGNKQQ